MTGINTVIAALSTIGFKSGVLDDDVIDRLNHWIMYGLLLVLAGVSGAKQYVGEPIFCWVPPQFIAKAQKRYVNNHCWVHSLYSVPFEDPIPFVEDDRWYNDVSYYRWASVFFITLALMFRLPHFLWRELKNFSGVNLERVIGMTLDTQLMEQDDRDRQLGHVAEFIHRWIMSRMQLSSGKGRLASARRKVKKAFACYGKRTGHHLVVTYLLIKFFYIINVIGQVFLISRFLKTNFWIFGFNALSSVFSDGFWENEYIFPRVAFCDMKVRQLNNVHTYTIQCVLALNLFLEKMFILLWFCLFLMLVANVGSFLKWAYQLASKTNTAQFLMEYSGIVASGNENDMKKFRNLAKKYLQPDGVFIVRMVAANTTDMMTVDLLRQIWLRYKRYLDSLQKDDRRTNGAIGQILNSDV